MRIESAATLKQQTAELLAELQCYRQPILMTQHGVPSAYLVDVESFEAMQDHVSLLEGIARGERALDEGHTLTHQQAKQRLKRWPK